MITVRAPQYVQLPPPPWLDPNQLGATRLKHVPAAALRVIDGGTRCHKENRLGQGQSPRNYIPLTWIETMIRARPCSCTLPFYFFCQGEFQIGPARAWCDWNGIR